MAKLHHTYYYQCPQCNKILTACDDVLCEDCDRYHEDDTSVCQGSPDRAVISGDIICHCNQQQVVATLVCQNMELQEEVAYLTEQLHSKEVLNAKDLE